jgi:hypothetical protein
MVQRRRLPDEIGAAMNAHDEGQMRLEEALDRVERGAHPLWLEQARCAVVHVAECKQEFTTDDVWATLDEWAIELRNDGRALGAVMRWAVKQGICTSTDNYKRSRRPECHLRPVTVWRSFRCTHESRQGASA